MFRMIEGIGVVAAWLLLAYLFLRGVERFGAGLEFLWNLVKRERSSVVDACGSSGNSRA